MQNRLYASYELTPQQESVDDALAAVALLRKQPEIDPQKIVMIGHGMYDLANGFIALPGGLGTLDEIFEVMTWQQIGLHHKPIALLDTAGFFQPLRTMVNTMIEQGFASLCCDAGILVDSDLEKVLAHALGGLDCEPN